MKTDSYLLFLKNYLAEHKQDFVASHETNNISAPEKILDTGLRVSHSPYGRKIQRCIRDDGSIDLERAFMATMFILEEETFERDMFYFESPTAPVVINIPEALLKATDAKPNSENTVKFFAGFGFEARPTENNRCGEVTPLESRKGANVRLLPSCFVAGHFDIQKGVFIENEKHISKLPQAEQDKIIAKYLDKFKALSTSQPQ